jgi:multiple sugar transport system substrate-binding protein
MVIRRLVPFVLGAAIAVGAMQTAFSETAGERAVREAQQYAGSSLTLHFSAGLMAMEPRVFSGPKWTELTGIKVEVVETNNDELFAKTTAEHRAGTGAFDIIDVIPMWLGDFVEGGVLEKLDPYIAKYDYASDLEDVAPTYRKLGDYGDGTYCFPDDGDQTILYYRKDLFDDSASDFKAQHGYDLAPPDTWEQFDEISQFLTDRYAPDVYGSGEIRVKGLIDIYYQERFRTAGGKFFDPDTMKATINSEAGVRSLDHLVKMRRYMPPGVDSWGYMEQIGAWLAGDIAMTISWPGLGRASAGYGSDHEAMGWLPKSAIAGKVGYALPPGGAPQQGGSFCLGVATLSENKDAAYLMAQWMNSSDVHPSRSMLPYGIRDPIRFSEFADPEYNALWPDAPEYLETLKQGSATALMDLSVRSANAYWDALARGVQAAITGTPSQEALDGIAAEWDEITERIGVEKQKKAYLTWANKPNAYPN